MSQRINSFIHWEIDKIDHETFLSNSHVARIYSLLNSYQRLSKMKEILCNVDTATLYRMTVCRLEDSCSFQNCHGHGHLLFSSCKRPTVILVKTILNLDFILLYPVLVLNVLYFYFLHHTREKH